MRKMPVLKLFFGCFLLSIVPTFVYAEGWSRVTDMGAWHSVHTSVVLHDGRVAVIGTYDYGTYSGGSGDPVDGIGGYIELYDPDTNQWNNALPSCDGTGSCPNASLNFANSATVLVDGRVLIAGGTWDGVRGTSVAQFYDPTDGSLRRTGSMDGFFGGPRFHHTAVLLSDGRVFIAGGQGVNAGEGQGSAYTAEIYNPATETWTLVAPMSTSRQRPESVLMDDGRVMVAGGGSAEIYDPASNTWQQAGAFTTNAGGKNFSMVKLDDGTIYVVGGSVSVGGTVSVEKYDPSSNQWTAVAPMNRARSFHSTVVLGNSSILAIGGHHFDASTTAEVYNPETDSWALTENLHFRRDWASAVTMQDGRALVTGTLVPERYGHTAEVYDPN